MCEIADTPVACCSSLVDVVHDDDLEMVVLELETVYAQVAPHTKLLNKRFVGAHNWLGPLKEAFVARLAADKVPK